MWEAEEWIPSRVGNMTQGRLTGPLLTRLSATWVVMWVTLIGLRWTAARLTLLAQKSLLQLTNEMLLGMENLPCLSRNTSGKVTLLLRYVTVAGTLLRSTSRPIMLSTLQCLLLLIP